MLGYLQEKRKVYGVEIKFSSKAKKRRADSTIFVQERGDTDSEDEQSPLEPLSPPFEELPTNNHNAVEPMEMNEDDERTRRDDSARSSDPNYLNVLHANFEYCRILLTLSQDTIKLAYNNPDPQLLEERRRQVLEVNRELQERMHRIPEMSEIALNGSTEHRQLEPRNPPEGD